jgi:hypothetical protein
MQDVTPAAGVDVGSTDLRAHVTGFSMNYGFVAERPGASSGLPPPPSPFAVGYRLLNFSHLAAIYLSRTRCTCTIFAHFAHTHA